MESYYIGSERLDPRLRFLLNVATTLSKIGLVPPSATKKQVVQTLRRPQKILDAIIRTRKLRGNALRSAAKRFHENLMSEGSYFLEPKSNGILINIVKAYERWKETNFQRGAARDAYFKSVADVFALGYSLYTRTGQSFFGRRFTFLGMDREKIGKYGPLLTVSALKFSDASVEISHYLSTGYVYHRARVTNDLPANYFKLSPFKPKTESTGFVVGGVNDSALISLLPSINGQSIEELEARMKPGKDSTAGFLGKKESLLEVMARDNDYVLSKGLTHQKLASHLKNILALFKLGVRNSEFTYRGMRYHIAGRIALGSQTSPFKDGTESNADIKLTNLSTGKSISFAALLIPMIERYGFYEGRGTCFRLDPQDIVDVFDLLGEHASANSTTEPLDSQCSLQYTRASLREDSNNIVALLRTSLGISRQAQWQVLHLINNTNLVDMALTHGNSKLLHWLEVAGSVPEIGRALLNKAKMDRRLAAWVKDKKEIWQYLWKIRMDFPSSRGWKLLGKLVDHFESTKGTRQLSKLLNIASAMLATWPARYRVINNGHRWFKKLIQGKAAPGLSLVRTIRLLGSSPCFNDDQTQQVLTLVNSPELANITHLDISGPGFTDEHAHYLAASCNLKNIRLLRIQNNTFSEDALLQLMSSPVLSNTVIETHPVSVLEEPPSCFFKQR